jgi:hypothetical protein
MTETVALVHPHETFQVLFCLVVQKCDLFRNNQTLAASPYTLNSQVSLDVFGEFVSALNDKRVIITKDNFRELSLLCKEFGFQDLASQILQFRDSDDFKKGTEAHISKPMKEINHCGTLFDEAFTFTGKDTTFECSVGQAVTLSPGVREQLSVDACARTFALRDARAVESVRSLLLDGLVSLVGSQVVLGLQLCSPGLELELELEFEFELGWSGTDDLVFSSDNFSKLSVEALDDIFLGVPFSIVSEDALLKWVLSLGEEYRSLLRWIEIRFLSSAGLTILFEHFAIPPEWVWCAAVDRLMCPLGPSPSIGWDSVITPEVPGILAEFCEKQFSLLWRGSRDGFSANMFHSRCDGHANTLTVILDTDGNVFGGFTPVEWDLCGNFKADASLKSFLFTLKNPHNVPARRFALKAEKQYMAIICFTDDGPQFGYDICVSNDCNANAGSHTFLGYSYTNDTGMDQKTFFTGAQNFRVQEIEMFEITA